ncbi:VanZ family protein [uncultured Corynebacterium sp.]|uniref:VanZ family protein n=1 Tax=uncultured Corynebacterium sp. TaxID=159447 RepID=UPI0025DDF31E|nr:VanZ family protein [uncultured Corynebacterium sp.]
MSLTKIRGNSPQPPAGTEPTQQDNNTMKKPSSRQPLARVIPFAFVVYGVVLIALTMFKSRLSLGGMWNTEAHQQRSLDLVLFNGFIDAPVWWGPWVNTFGNIVLFMPFGFFLYFLLRSHSSRFPLLEVTLFSALASLGIEVLQWGLSVGYSDVDDLLFNTIGGIIGGTIASRLPRAAVTRLSLIITGSCLAVLLLIASSSFR